MTLPKADGARVNDILGKLEQQLAQNQQLYLDVALLVYGEDKKAAVELLKPLSTNNTIAVRALTLIRAKQYAQAEDVIAEGRKLLKGQTKS